MNEHPSGYAGILRTRVTGQQVLQVLAVLAQRSQSASLRRIEIGGFFEVPNSKALISFGT
jgi:hypothetical protein